MTGLMQAAIYIDHETVETEMIYQSETISDPGDERRRGRDLCSRCTVRRNRHRGDV